MGFLGRLFGSPSSRFLAAMDHADDPEGRMAVYSAFLALELAVEVDEAGHAASFKELSDNTRTLITALDDWVMRHHYHADRTARFPARAVCAMAFAHECHTLAVALRRDDTADYSPDTFWEVDRDAIAWLMVGLLPWFRTSAMDGPGIFPTDEQRSGLRGAVADLDHIESAFLSRGIGPDRSKWPTLEVLVEMARCLRELGAGGVPR